ncbi:MAG: DNA repair protein RecN [Syntrophothermus sp.]
MMLKLTIENYALIDSLDIDISEGFSVITGETGAGKSILLGALGLLLGQRADTGVLLNKDKKCVVEGIFNTSGYAIESFFSDHELDYEVNTILRREITPAGKSRAFINDTPVNLTLLKDLGDKLVNIHSQNSITTLNDASFQMAVVDSYAGNSDLLGKYKSLYRRFKEMNKKLEDLILQESRLISEQDYLSFQHNELLEAKLVEGEQEETEQRVRMLAHAEEIKSSLFTVMDILSEGEVNVLHNLSAAISSLHQLETYHPFISEITRRMEGNLIDLKDISLELANMEQEVIFDPAELETLTSRMDLIYHLEKKNNVSSVEELIRIREELTRRLEQTVTLSEEIGKIRSEISLTGSELDTLAKELSSKRKAICSDIEKKIQELLSRLAMPHARFRVEITQAGDLNPEGRDLVRFLFSANQGTSMNDVAKIASGGELSRLMLSIKSLIAAKKLLPTIIFDEIDSGVSGEVAGKVGNILFAMGKTMQVIAITHLPQIAGQGSTHFQVYKQNENGSARTSIKKLSRDERVTEIAKMLSNEKVTDAALNTARELLLN